MWGPAFCFWPQPINSTLNPGLIGANRGRDEESVEPEKSQKKKRFFTPNKLGKIGQNQHFWGPTPGAHRLVSKFPNLELFWPISSNISLFSPFLTPNKSQHLKVFWNKSLFFERIRPRDPSQMKDLKILRRIHLTRAHKTLIRPTWWQKNVKNLKNVVFQTVFQLFSYQDDFLATWDPSQMKDLKMLPQIHLTRALYDGIWPSLCRFKVPKFMFFCDKNVHIPQTSYGWETGD